MTTVKEIKKRLWWQRGVEYKLEQVLKDGLGRFVHAPLIGKPAPHTFIAPIKDILETSFCCVECDKTFRESGETEIKLFLRKKDIDYKAVPTRLDVDILWLNRKGKKIGIVYLDKRFFKNVVDENERAKAIRKIMKKNFDHSIILTHLEYKNLKKNLLKGLKEIW
jgi:hypothetical protein